MKSIIAALIFSSAFSCYSQEEKTPETETETETEEVKVLPTVFDASPKLKGLNSKLNGLYLWKNAVLMTRCNENGRELNNEDDPEVYISESGQQFRIIQANDSFAVIQILDYAKSKKAFIEKKNDLKQISFRRYNYEIKSVKQDRIELKTMGKSHQYGDAQKYFKVKTTDIDRHAKDYRKISPSIAFGLLNLPFKARIQAKRPDFSGSLNINNAIGITYGHQSWRKMKFSTIISYGVSSTHLDSISVTRNHNRLTSSNTFPTLTLSLGQVITFDKIQIGIFIGVDRLSRQNQDTYGWLYNGDPWLSVGFGYSIFSVKKENTKTTERDLNQKINKH